MQLQQASEKPLFVVVLLLTAGEFGYSVYLLFDGHAFYLYLAIRYFLGEKYSPFHYLHNLSKKICWRHCEKI